MLTIGESIKKHRQDADMKQCDFAKKIGVNQCVVSWWESGKIMPSLFSAIAIADALNISLDELVGRTVASDETN